MTQTDYLSSIAWSPGEFERKQKEHDRRLEAIGAVILPYLREPVKRLALDMLLSTTLEEAELEEHAAAEAFIAANYVWAGWVEALEENAGWTADQKLVHAIGTLLLHCDWREELVGHEASLIERLRPLCGAELYWSH